MEAFRNIFRLLTSASRAEISARSVSSTNRTSRAGAGAATATSPPPPPPPPPASEGDGCCGYVLGVALGFRVKREDDTPVGKLSRGCRNRAAPDAGRVRRLLLVLLVLPARGRVHDSRVGAARLTAWGSDEYRAAACENTTGPPRFNSMMLRFSMSGGGVEAMTAGLSAALRR